MEYARDIPLTMESLNLVDNLRALPERVGGRFGIIWGTLAEECRRVDLERSGEEGCIGSVGGVGSDGEEVRGTCRLPDPREEISV